METAAGDEILTPPRESQVPLPLVCQRVPLVSTPKKSAYPLHPAGACIPPDEVTAGPVPAIVVPLTLAALLTTAKSETSIRVARKMLVVIRLFIRIAFLDVLRLKRKNQSSKWRRDNLSVVICCHLAARRA